MLLLYAGGARSEALAGRLDIVARLDGFLAMTGIMQSLETLGPGVGSDYSVSIPRRLMASVYCLVPDSNRMCNATSVYGDHILMNSISSLRCTLFSLFIYLFFMSLCL